MNNIYIMVFVAGIVYAWIGLFLCLLSDRKNLFSAFVSDSIFLAFGSALLCFVAIPFIWLRYWWQRRGKGKPLANTISGI